MLHHKAFIEKATKVLADTNAQGGQFVLYLDITEFRMVNRQYGMAEGDALLLAMEDYLSGQPTIAAMERVFSDQFVCLILTPTSTDSDKVAQRCQRACQEFLAPQKQRYPACNLKVACGLYAIQGDGLLEAIDGANLARKEAKRRGAMAPVVFDQNILDSLARRQEAEQDILLSLREDRFLFYLQPKVDLTTGAVIGAEALARRINKKGYLIYPDSFLEIMEENGTIVELDLLIYRKVCQFLAKRIAQGEPIVRTSVNLSRLHIQDPTTAQQLHAIAQEYDIPPDYLEFELTETILLHEFTGAKQLIDELRQYHYHVSIDDFGSGYAGINIWQELRFDTLKLDRKFLSSEEELKQRNAAIVPNIINIAQQLGVEVICEGVEQKEQCRYLLRLGCTAVQGFFFSRAVPPEEFYETFQRQEGHFPLTFLPEQATGEPPQAPPAGEKQPPHQQHSAPRHALLLTVLAVFLAACVFVVLYTSHRSTAQLFDESICANLTSYITNQRTSTAATVDGLTTTLGTFATYIQQRGSTANIANYIDALNEYESSVQFSYSTLEQYQERVKNGQVRTDDVYYMARLQNNEVVVSEIVYSNRLHGNYCFVVGVPVFVDGQFVGALQAYVKAGVLTSTQAFASPYGLVAGSFLIDGDGLLVQTANDQVQRGQVLRDLLVSFPLSEEVTKQLENAMHKEGAATTVPLGTEDGVPYYLSVADLPYNDWNLVVAFRADAAQSIIGSILHNTVACTLVLIVAILMALGFLFAYLRRWQRKIDESEHRYLLLERFSDTVLFEYNCQKDLVRFTPNATQLFQLSALEQSNFLDHLGVSPSLFHGDYPLVRNLMHGSMPGESPEIRIRLRHPQTGTYFWCLIQCKYIFRNGQVHSIIGKIVNIDDQQRREESLLELSSRDGLTNLYNQSTTKEMVESFLHEDATATLLVLDVDDFKHINDTMGHDAGDRALCFLARSLGDIFRSQDVVGRIGGDELLVYIRELDDTALVQERLDALRHLLAQADGVDIPRLTVSIGVAHFPADGQSYEELFRAADQAMYHVKNTGKAQRRFFRSSPDPKP